jgi:hypothetical protein
MRNILRPSTGVGRVTRMLVSAGVLLGLAVPAQAVVDRQSSPHSRASAARSSRQAGAPRCTYSFYDPKPDASGLSGQQANQLDLVEGVFGLNAKHTKLRVVVTIKNLSKSIPAPANYMDYEVYWTNPAGDSGPNAVDATVSKSGKVTFSDGTVTVVNNNTQYSPNATNSATGTFGHGPSGKIEFDVPLSALKLKVGKALGKPIGQTASGASSPAGSLGSVADSDQGKSYKLGQRTCIDPERRR